MNFCYFVIISPWKRPGPFIWINLNRLHPRMFCANLVEIGPVHVVLEKMIFVFCQYIFTLSLLSPLGKGCGTSFVQIWIPFTKKCFVSSLVEIGPVVLEKKKKMWKVYDNDNGLIVIRKKYLLKLYENFPNMPVSSYNEVTSLCLFVCLGFFIPLENYSLIWRRHHYQWRTANFDLSLALMAIEQWGFFSM